MINTNFNIQGGSAWWAMGANRTQMLRSMNNALFGFSNGANQSTSTEDLRNALVSARRGADTTRSVVNDLRTGNASNTTMQSSDTDVLTVTSSNRLSNTAGGMTVEVEQLAQNQRNEGNFLTSNELATEYGFDVGMNQISINIGDRSFNFSFQVSATDTTRDVQDRIANAINVRPDVAVRASVETNNDNGTSRLVLESTEPGVARNTNFTVTSNTGNALSFVGGDTVTQEARNAEFRVNRTTASGNTIQGALQTSRTNDVQLGFGVSATLESTGTAQVTPSRDNVGQQNVLRRMVNGLNDMVEAANGAGGDNRLQRELSNLARSSASALERIGITRNSDGFFRIDETRMANAAESGEVDRFISNATSGGSFMSRLDRIASDVNRRPETMLGQDTDRFGGNRPNRWTNQLNQMMGFGMLFDTNM
jgi:hypothetical protein